MEFKNVIGVQFRRAGKIYDFDGGGFSLKVGDPVVVDTDRGPSLAHVARLRYTDSQQGSQSPLKKIVRPASDKDVTNRSILSEDEALSITRKRAHELGLDMHVLKAEIQFSGNKCILYFSAPGRVDFRDLVKDLATRLRTRVELKQVGARDEAKLIGGLGICGREFCCSSFLREFVPVSIKMAKNQNLALNPTKISGGCGRLLCCLTYEDATYSEMRKIMPPRGTRVRNADGSFGDVLKSDFLNQSVLVELEDGHQQVFKLDQVKVVDRNQGIEEDSWGDDIDFDALSSVEDTREVKMAPPEAKRDENRNHSNRSGGRDEGSTNPRGTPNSQRGSHDSHRGAQDSQRGSQDSQQHDSQNSSNRKGRHGRGGRNRNKGKT